MSTAGVLLRGLMRSRPEPLGNLMSHPSIKNARVAGCLDEVAVFAAQDVLLTLTPLVDEAEVQWVILLRPEPGSTPVGVWLVIQDAVTGQRLAVCARRPWARHWRRWGNPPGELLEGMSCE